MIERDEWKIVGPALGAFALIWVVILAPMSWFWPGMLAAGGLGLVGFWHLGRWLQGQ